MLIPLGTDRPLRRPSVVTPALIAACVVAFMVQIVAEGRDPGGLEARFWVIGGEGFAVYRTVTYAFLHGGLMHLLGNMLFLWVFGRAVEDRLGRLGFTAFYLGGAVAGGLAHAMFEAGPAVGASGAISAVTGAFLVLFPRTRIKILWFLILITVMQAPAWFFIGLQIAWNLLAQTTGRGAEGVAVLAHLAGYAFGFSVAFVLLATGVLGREPYDLFTISKQAKRRREFRSLNRPAARATTPARGRPRAEAERSEELAEARAAVSRPVSVGEPGEAEAAYRALLDRHGADRAAVTLARNTQYTLATALYTRGAMDLAVRAFDDFLAAFPRDPEGPQIRLLLGRLLAERGADRRAAELLREAAGELDDPALRAMADDELGRLEASGAIRPAGGEPSEHNAAENRR